MSTVIYGENVADTSLYHVSTLGVNEDVYAQAAMLKDLGILQGTQKGLELERPLTRVEAAVLLVRFYGAEEQVFNNAYEHPFKDVPKWADSYVGWLYQSGLTEGISDDEYGAGLNTSFEHFAIFMSRGIVGNDNWLVNGIASQEEKDFFDSHEFTRYTCVSLMARALQMTYRRNGNCTYSMSQFFVDHQVFNEETLLKAGSKVLPVRYIAADDGKIHMTIAGVDVLSTEVQYKASVSSYDVVDDFFYISGQHEDVEGLYQIDKRTLESMLITESELDNTFVWKHIPITSLNNEVYFFMYNKESKVISLNTWNGREYVEVIDELTVTNSQTLPWENSDYYLDDKQLFILGVDKNILVENGEIYESKTFENKEVLGFHAGYIITQECNDKETIIESVRCTDGEVMDHYRVEQDSDVEHWERKVLQEQEMYYYGEAGFYQFDVEKNHLYQITDLPTCKALEVQDEYYIISHEPGFRAWSAYGFAGNQILKIDQKGEVVELLTNSQVHGITISRLTQVNDDGTIEFSSDQGIGMGKSDTLTYQLVLNKDGVGLPSINVLNFQPGRLEPEENSIEIIIEEEQERLDELGY